MTSGLESVIALTEIKGKLTPQNKFEVIASRVMQCGIKEEVKIKR